MNAFINKNLKEVTVGCAIILAYFFTRLYNISSLPLFTDEAIYTRWAQIARYDAFWRFISLTDGKQPSFIWLDMILMRFTSDPLLAGRLVSVFAGFFTMVGLLLLTHELFKNLRIAMFASFLYVIFPFALVYDRMALYDSLVGAFMIWSLYLAILLVKKVRLDIALILGMVIGGGVLTKTSSFFSMPLLFPTLLLFNWKQKARISQLLKWLGLASIVIVLAFGYYSILRLSPLFHEIGRKNEVFAYPLREWLEHPMRFFIGNMRGLFDWLITYYTIPLFILIPFSFVLIGKGLKKDIISLTKIIGVFILSILFFYGVLTFLKVEVIIPEILPFLSLALLFICAVFAFFRRYEFFNEKIILFIWFAVPFVYLAFFGKTLYPRFILFMTLFLLPLVSYSLINIIESFKFKPAIFITYILFLFLPLKADYYILTDFARAPIPFSDLEQYINGWPAGGGVKEIITYLTSKAENRKIYVATEGTFGSLPTYAVEIYLGDNKNVDKRGIWPLSSTIPDDLVKKSKDTDVYLILNQTQEPPYNWPIKLINRYQKGIGDSYMSLYEVINQ